MNFYIKETIINKTGHRNATIKPRDDIEFILNSMGWEQLDMVFTSMNRKECSIRDKMRLHRIIYQNWKKITRQIKKGDALMIQFPVREHTIYLGGLLRQLRRKGIKVIFLIHDLETIRVSLEKDKKFRTKVRIWIEEMDCINQCSEIIVHNSAMTDLLKKKNWIPDSKIIELKIFDYLIPGYKKRNEELYKDFRSFIVAGSLAPEKAGYLYHLSDDIPVHLYGIDYSGKVSENIHFYGAYPPDELPGVMEGGFGLVWDGESVNTCAGIYGEYLRYNNPHKASLYLSSDIPVIIWEKAAMAEFVQRFQCGITVASIHEIKERLHDMKIEEYLVYKRNAEEVGKLLREGYYTKKATTACFAEK